MANMEKKVKSLSSGVLALKFMHRAEEQQLRRKLEEEQAKAQEEAKWVSSDFDRDGFEGVQFEFDSSHVPFLASPCGRISFGAFNKDVENLSKEASSAARSERAAENESRDSISETEMVNRYMLNDTNACTPGIAEKASKRKRAAAGGDGSPAQGPQTKKRSPAVTNGVVIPQEDWEDMRGRKATRFMPRLSATPAAPTAEKPTGFLKPQ
ncbi:hypothetical protein HKX48_004036 [Thoreauomyces humboldtii]|nr:hypothetical protein HKX48_004036 [Thoreauomyces humboldtii]